MFLQVSMQSWFGKLITVRWQYTLAWKKMAVLQNYFYWSKLRQDVSKYIKSCIACSISNPTIKKQGLYTPLPTLDRPWESISLDYMSGLPSTKHGNDCVFVVVDQFFKMKVFSPYRKSIISEATTNLLFELVLSIFHLAICTSSQYALLATTSTWVIMFQSLHCWNLSTHWNNVFHTLPTPWY